MRRFLLMLYLTAGSVLITCPLMANPTDQIRDVRAFSQTPSSYVTTVNADTVLVTQNSAITARFLSRYFEVWHNATSNVGLASIQALFSVFEKKPGYGENLMPHSAAWIRDLAANADLSQFPNADIPAITVLRTPLRALPTLKPVFESVTVPYKSYPFDMLQNCTLPPNLPVRIRQVSRDGAWVWVESPLTWGWVPVESVAVVDDKCMADFEEADFVAVMADQSVVTDEKGLFRFYAQIGMILPRVSGGELSDVYIMSAGVNRKAVLLKARISSEQVSEFPVPSTVLNVAQLADRLAGLPYAWGGAYGDRDSGLLLRDLFFPFGVWLPRYTAEYLHAAVHLKSFTAGADVSEKQQEIMESGIPFSTLIFLQGHTMLYLGHALQTPLVFHSLWGLSTTGKTGEGRFIIGKSVVTTLRPGAELPELMKATGLLLPRVTGYAPISDYMP